MVERTVVLCVNFQIPNFFTPNFAEYSGPTAVCGPVFTYSLIIFVEHIKNVGKEMEFWKQKYLHKQ